MLSYWYSGTRTRCCAATPAGCVTQAGPLWFAPLARLIPRNCWPGIFPVTPATLLSWHRQIDQLSVGFGESVIRRLSRQIGGYACGFVMGSGYAP